MARDLRAFWQDDRGTEMVEWALVAVIILTATVYVMLWTQDEFLSVIDHIFHQVELAPKRDF